MFPEETAWTGEHIPETFVWNDLQGPELIHICSTDPQPRVSVREEGALEVEGGRGEKGGGGRESLDKEGQGRKSF